MTRIGFLSGLLRQQPDHEHPASNQKPREEPGTTVRYRMSLTADMRRYHANASRHMRALLDACRTRDPDRAVATMREFAYEFRHIGLTRSVFLCPYLRWALEKDKTATLQFEATYGELAHSTQLIEAMLTDYLGTPWDDDRRRRFMHVVARLANLFSRGIHLEATILLPLYVPPGQYRYVRDTVA